MLTAKAVITWGMPTSLLSDSTRCVNRSPISFAMNSNEFNATPDLLLLLWLDWNADNKSCKFVYSICCTSRIDANRIIHQYNDHFMILTLTPDKLILCRFGQFETRYLTWSAFRLSQPAKLRPLSSEQFFAIFSNIEGTFRNDQPPETFVETRIRKHFIT